MFSWIGAWLRAILITLFTLVLAAGVYAAWALTRPAPADDGVHLAAKRDYLANIRSYPHPPDAPNILFFLFDDMGYGDIGVGRRGGGPIRTPNIDRLAAGGVVLSDFHSPSPVCTPSRAGYLTGRLAPRAGLPEVIFPTGSATALFPRLLKPGSPERLPAEEITLADVLGAAGYRTGMVGKWHLGDRSPSLPNDMGFDSFYGALYSNDMQPFAWYRNRDIDTPAPADQERMTEVYTQEAIKFIEADGDQPFFLYFAHNFPHRPLHARPSRRGRSDGGLYGDVLEEIDDSVGQIVDVLRARGELDNTLIIISSDNGPWFLGDAGAQRGRKGTTFEGGTRVPFIAHWPARIPGGRLETAMAMGVDLLPTVLEILQLQPPADRVLDGLSILGLLTAGGPSPHDYLYYYAGEQLFAVRDQQFKYRGPIPVHYGTDDIPLAFGIPQKAWLFDLARDPRESYDTTLRHPQEMAALKKAFELKQAEMEANPRGWYRGG